MIFKIFELKQLIRIIKYLNFNTIYEYMENTYQHLFLKQN